MDILAHALWAGAALALVARRRPVRRRTAVATVALAALPDLGHLLPVLGWALFGGGTLAGLHAYVVAEPGQEPAMPALVALLSHHLHCTLHSVFVAGGVTLLIAWLTRSFWLPLLGWWLHIGIDVFTHSADFYPVPLLYPLTYAGFDGIAWNTPWFQALNYAALAAVAAWLAFDRRRRRRPLARP